MAKTIIDVPASALAAVQQPALTLVETAPVPEPKAEMEFSPEQLIGKYYELQAILDAKTEAADKVKKQLTEGMTLIEKTVTDFLLRTGQTSTPTANGTAFRTSKDSVKVSDWEQVRIFLSSIMSESVVAAVVAEQKAAAEDPNHEAVPFATLVLGAIFHSGAWPFLTKNVTKDVVKAYLKENEKLPNGVKRDEWKITQFRKPTAKG